MQNNSEAARAALTALECWVASVQGAGKAAPDIPDAVRRAAWLVCGKPEASGLPTFDPKKRLRSIFSRVKGKDDALPPEAFVRRAELSLHENVLFPVLKESEAATTSADPAESLVRAAEALRGLDDSVRLEGLLFAFQRYAWCLPSPLDAVSLYDFARTHAAVAAAQANGTGLFLLGGDLSGVQQFIYTLTAEGATKQLRGRSFYLQLLTDACAHAVLEAAEMPLTNLLYAGGGRFYALVPGSFATRLPQLRREVGELLLRNHQGELYLALGGAPYPVDGDSATVWEQVSLSLDRAKRRRFAELDEEKLFTHLFTPHQPLLSADPNDPHKGLPQDELSESLEDLGRNLTKSDYLLAAPRRPGASATDEAERDGKWHQVLRILGLGLRPIQSDSIFSGRGYLRLLAMNDRDQQELEELRSKLPKSVFGLRYTTNVAPLARAKDVKEYNDAGLGAEDKQELREQQVKPFSLLVHQSKGVKRLGVLRMDVDDLGELFGGRLQRQDSVSGAQQGGSLAGLAYTAALSAALSRFFEGRVGELCRKANENIDAQGSVYAVYSGGDDLFIVGSWHRMPELAATIRNEFVRYTTGLAAKDVAIPPITLSGGISLHGAKFPLYQAAEESHEALDQAKSYTRPDKRAKDALTLFGETVGWEHYDELRATQEQLVRLVDSGAPRALLMQIQALFLRYSQGTKLRRTLRGETQFEYGPWVWQGAYTLTRLAERCPEAIRSEVQGLRDRIITKVESRFIERAGPAARWAQLLMRGEEGMR